MGSTTFKEPKISDSTTDADGNITFSWNPSSEEEGKEYKKDKTFYKMQSLFVKATPEELENFDKVVEEINRGETDE